MAEPIQLPPGRMTRLEFYAWAEEQPRGRFELEEGRVVAMAPERAGHARANARAWLALRNAIAAADLSCEAFSDGMTIAVDDHTAYEPDTLVNCGDRINDGSVVARNPVIVVEVASPSTSRVDAVAKFANYMRLDAVHHYLLVDALKRIVIHHRKLADGTIPSAIQGAGPLALDPPGITIRIEDLFEG